MDLPISVENTSKEDIKKAIRTLKNGKAAGPDGIPAEAIKADIDTATDILHNLFAKIWDEEKVPADWREGLVIKFPKKGDLRDCCNYKGIMLLSDPGKVLNRVILDRVKDAVDPQLRDHKLDSAETDLVLTKLPVYELLLNSRSSGILLCILIS